MSEFKTVPMEPTPEMVEAAEEAYMPFGDMDLAIRMAVLTAPAVQGEPVAYAAFSSNGNIQLWCADPTQIETLRQEYGEALQPLYTAPQPAPSNEVGLVELLEHISDGCQRRDLPSESAINEWADRIDAALAAHRKQGGEV